VFSIGSITGSSGQRRSEERVTRSLADQVTGLKTDEERQLALQRTTRASQVVLARSIILDALAVLSGR